MNISKEVRYAMIRNAVRKVQRTSKILKSNRKLALEVELIDRQDYKSEINFGDISHITNEFADIAKTQP